MKQKKGRPPLIPQIFYEYDFAMEAKKAPTAKLKMKLLALKHLQSGAYYHEVAKTFQTHKDSVKAWMNRFLKEGLEGLKDKPGRGRKSMLAKDLLGDFKQAVINLQATRTGGRINAADITKMTNEKFGTTYKVKSMYDVLHKTDLVWISSRSIHPAHNAESQEAFKKTL